MRGGEGKREFNWQRVIHKEQEDKNLSGTSGRWGLALGDGGRGRGRNLLVTRERGGRKEHTKLGLKREKRVRVGRGGGPSLLNQIEGKEKKGKGPETLTKVNEVEKHSPLREFQNEERGGPKRRQEKHEKGRLGGR